MKKLILIILFSIIAISCKAQVTGVVPLRNYECPNGSYRKDLNYELDYFTGIWEGTLNNKKYTFHFVKFNQVYFEGFNNSYYYKDVIKVKFKVVDLFTNQVFYDDTLISNIDNFKTSSSSFIGNGNGTLSFMYTDEENCDNTIVFTIHKVTNQPNQIKYCNFEYLGINPFANCPYENQEDIPMFLPKQDLILTKL